MAIGTTTLPTFPATDLRLSKNPPPTKRLTLERGTGCWADASRTSDLVLLSEGTTEPCRVVEVDGDALNDGKTIGAHVSGWKQRTGMGREIRKDGFCCGVVALGLSCACAGDRRTFKDTFHMERPSRKKGAKASVLP